MASGKWPRANPAVEAAFRCKGNVYLGLFEHLEKNVRGGVTAALEAARDPELKAFASQRFLAASWYDAIPISAFGEAAALAGNLSYDSLMRDFGTAQAERDIRGVYQFLLRFASPSMVIERLPRAARQYFDFVNSELLTAPRSPAELHVSGIPREFAAVYCLVTEPFLRRALTLAGAKDVQIDVTPFESEPPAHGFAIVRFTRRIAWS
jgi:hypothetical protein